MHSIMMSPMDGMMVCIISPGPGSIHELSGTGDVGWDVGSLDMVPEEQVSGWIPMMFFFILVAHLLGGVQPVDSRAAL